MIELIIAIIGGLICAIVFTIGCIISDKQGYDSSCHRMEKTLEEPEYFKNAFVVFVGISVIIFIGLICASDIQQAAINCTNCSVK